MITFILLNTLIIFWIIAIIRNRHERKTWLLGITACSVLFTLAYSSLLWHTYDIEHGACIYHVVVLDDPVRCMFTSEEKTYDYLCQIEHDDIDSKYKIMKSAWYHAPIGYFVSIDLEIITPHPYPHNRRLLDQIVQEVVQKYMEQQQEDRRRGVRLRSRPITPEPDSAKATAPSDEQ